MAFYSVCDIGNAWPAEPPATHAPTLTSDKAVPTEQPIQLIEIPPTERRGRRAHTPTRRTPARRSRRHADPHAVGSPGTLIDSSVLSIIVVVVCCILTVQIILGVLIVYYMSSMQTLLLQYIMSA